MTSNALGVYCLDVGQGDATIVVPPDGRAVVFDCRDDSVVNKLLTHWKVDEIAAVVISHLDMDHIAGMAQLLARWSTRVRRVYLSADRDISDDLPDRQTAKELVDRVIAGASHPAGKPGGWDVVPCHRNPEPILRGDGWSINLLAPDFTSTLERERDGKWKSYPNLYSAVLHVEMAGVGVLIGGDAPLSTWAGILPLERPVRLFRVPHHGGALDDGGIPEGWSVTRLYEEVNPAEVVVSVGTGNPHSHPNPEWLALDAGDLRRLLCTQVTTHCHPSLPDEISSLRIEVLRRDREYFAEPAWRHLTDGRHEVKARAAEVPCAGTVVVRINEDGSVRVSPSAEGGHADIVSLWECPLCRRARRA